MFRINLFILLFLLFPRICSGDNSLIVQSTTSTYNSGFYEYILPIIKSEINVVAHVVSVGTGAALKNAANCDGDVLIVHAKKRELKFVKNGFGLKRYNLMYNDFIIVGPKENPAKINLTDDPITSFTKIFTTSSIFISRSDDSGTHFKEISIWDKAKLKPIKFSGKWYRETGSGMGATLNIAAGMAGYTLTDRATWTTFGNKADLDILIEGDKNLFNPYGVMLISKNKCPTVNTKAGQAFIDWLLSETGQSAISAFRVDDKQLFFAHAQR